MNGEKKIDYYKVLGLSRNASLEDIVYSYRTLAKKYHPDVPKGDEDNFKLLAEAYKTLRDPIERDKYDASLNGQTIGYHNSPVQTIFNEHFSAYFIGVGIVYIGIIFALFFIFDAFNFIAITIAMIVYGVFFFLIFKKLILGEN